MPVKTTTTRLRSMLAVVFAVATLASVVAHSSPTSCARVFHPEVRSRVEIANPQLAVNNFNTARGINEYQDYFPFTRTEKMRTAVRGLERGSVWIDMGAGQGRALHEGLKLNRGIEAVGVAFKKPAISFENGWFGARFRYLEGDYVENMARDGKLDEYKERVDLLTDVYGPLSYSEHLPELLQVYLDLLVPGGRLYANVMTERNYEPRTTIPGEVFFPMNEVVRNGRVVPDGLLAWLRSIPGIEILDVADYETKRTIKERSRAFVIRKTHSHVTVPLNLKSIYYRESSPPIRRFEIEERH